MNELNEHGLLVWKHRTNKRLFLEKPYRWKDTLTLLDETEGRQIVDNFSASTFNFNAWEPMVKLEYNNVNQKYMDIYE